MNEHMKATAKEADVLNEVTPTVSLINGDVITIHKCKVKQIGEVLRFLSFLMNSIGMKDISDKPTKDLNNPSTLMMIIADGADQIYPVAVSLCSLDMDAFVDLDVEDAMAIMLAEWDVNKSFFLHKVMPMLGVNSNQKSPTSKVSRKKRSTRKKRAT